MGYSTVVVETKNRTLEETAALFDGEDILNEIVVQAAAQVHEPHINDNDEKLSDSFHETTPEVPKV